MKKADRARRAMPAREAYSMGIDEHSSIPIFRQLSLQIRHLVLSGHLKSGARLPSARQLADNLNIHRNTVRKAYVELARTGFIVGRGSRGTFVSDNTGGSLTGRSGVLDIVHDLIAEAERSRIDPSELASMVFSEAMARRSVEGGSIVFIECNPTSLDHYTKEITRAVGIRVIPLLLEALDGCSMSTPRPLAAVTTFFHYADVRRRLRENSDLASVELVAISVRPHLEALQELNELPHGTRLGIAYVQGDRYASDRLRRMHDAISHARLTNVLPVPLPLSINPEPHDFDDVDAVLVRPENIGQWRETIPSRVKVIEFVNTLDDASISLLHEILADARRLQRDDR